MSGTYKLTYFDVRGRAEPIRLIFAYAGVPYDDVRIQGGDWPKLKPNFPWGAVPVLEVDGQMLAQSLAICRYLGKKFNIAGDNEFEEGKCDEMLEAMADLSKASQPAFHEKDDETKKGLVEKLNAETFPKFLGKYNEILESNGGFLVGSKLSYADIVIAGSIQLFVDNFGGASSILGKYPALQAHQESVLNAPGIKEYIENRPKSVR